MLVYFRDILINKFMKTTKSQNFGQDEIRKKITQGGIHAVVSYHKKDVLSSERSYAYDKPDMTI